MKHIFFYITIFLCLPVLSVQANTYIPANKKTVDIILATDHSLIAPEGSRHQWYLNNIPISDATEKEVQVTSSGFYKVEYTSFNGTVLEKQTMVGITAAGAIIRIFTIGDSTVQDYNAGYYPRKGWGQVLNSFFNVANVSVINKAVGGTSSKSYYNSFWAAVRNSLQAGDFVFIQFGINDRNKTDAARYAPTGGVFESYLTKFVNETKAKGAYPVLVSTLRRNAWNADGITVYDSYHDHPVAVRTVAKNLDVPLIDLDAKAKVLLQSVGQAYSTRFFYNNYIAGEYTNYPNGNNDDVHFQEMGAIEMAKLVTQGIRELSTDPNVKKLIPFLKPEYQIGVTVNPSGADIVTTRTTTYPQGLTITLKTIPKTANTFQKWNNASNTQISTANLTTVTSGSSATSYTAMYKGATGCTALISTSTATTFCIGGSVLLTASTGNAYKWFNGTAQVGTQATLTVTQAGAYAVEVTNASGCKALSDIKTITVNASPSITQYVKIDADAWTEVNKASACEGSTVNLGPHPNLAAGWSWTGPGNYSSTLRNPILSTISTTNTGTYTATYTDPNGCKATSTFLLQVSTPTAVITSSATAVCPDGSVLLTASTGNAYKWFKGTTQAGTASTLTVTEAGGYTVEVTNASGCKTLSAIKQISSLIPATWYEDADNDGKGDPASSVSSCTKPKGYIESAGDACPADPHKTAAGNCGCGNTEASCLDCAGIPNGTAVLDNCNICVGGTTGKTACITTSTSTTIFPENIVSIYPQPFSNTLTVSLKKNTVKSVTFLNLQGLLVEYRPGNDTSEIQSGESLPSGLYFIIIESETEVYTAKVIKY